MYVCTMHMLLLASIGLRRLCGAALRRARFDTRRRHHRQCNLPLERRSHKVASACQGQVYAASGGGW